MSDLITKTLQENGVTFHVTVPHNAADAFAALLASALLLTGASSKAVLKEQREPPEKRLKALRLSYGLTQRDVALKVGTTQARISDMEAGVRPITPEVAAALAGMFQVSIQTFID